MFNRKQNQINDLTSRLAWAEATIANLQGIIARAGGQGVLDMQGLASQMAADHEQAMASLNQARQEAEAGHQQAMEALAKAQQEAEADHQRRLKALDKNLTKVTRNLERAQEQERKTVARIAEQRQELDALTQETSDIRIMVDAGLNPYPHPAQSSLDLRVRLEDVRSRIKSMVRDKTAIKATSSFTFNNSSAKGRKFVSDMSKMMLRAYNSEAENCVLTVKAGNGDAARKRLERTREQAERLGTLIDLKVTHEYHRLRLEELELALAYQNAKKAEKEAEREERARLREERKAQQELEAQRAKLSKEMDHYRNVLASLRAEGRENEAATIEARLNHLHEEIDKVDSRAANIRAGYVYVISNIGAFGERMVKIGMTRRLEPMDRVRELGDASVPFGFDVHALFFSEDAVGVENRLHHHFADRRVNRVNTRREFFYVTPAQVRDALTQVAEGSLLEFTEVPEAEQYRMSLQIAEADTPSHDASEAPERVL
ncbi:DUF4041 domain-containing protein [Actinomyces capricornis]|uniref:Bacteriophage T5 Orf172 DNA-binding domain-containing protein n=1 Tax=Actinomyces capricornis TaxID=2755559 RepID=A0ABM7U9J7_9ACTO|nr:DUF4041 domain-containing protein [Actinomyces capricornis]BDA64025.1 hypothetical protein MANAM107_08590 [Actinomyces capricornis]